MTGDELVLSMLEAGDTREAATTLLRTHGPSVLRYLRSLLREEGAVDDAFSLFAEWAWSGISRFRGDSSLRTWAFGIAWNAARRVSDEAWRKHKKRLKTRDASKLAQEIRASSALELDRQSDKLEELRRELSPEERNLLALRIDQQLSWDEIAAILASNSERVSVAVLRKRFERLKERIARMARERGLVKR
jgi:RNA polymerase sigma-70 factor (ECF subfamily)